MVHATLFARLARFVVLFDVLEAEIKAGTGNDALAYTSAYEILKAQMVAAVEAIFASFATELGGATALENISRYAQLLEKDSGTIEERTIRFIAGVVAVDDDPDYTMVSPGTNVGNGKLITSFRKGGLFTPAEGPFVDVMRCVCTSPGASATFRLVGQSVVGAKSSYRAVGSGLGPTLAIGKIATNGDFELWTTGTPPALLTWILNSGTYGVNLQRSITAHIGTYALEYLLSNSNIEAPITLGSGLEFAVCNFYARKETNATGNIIVTIINENGTTVATTTVVVAELTTAYAFKYFVIPVKQKSTAGWKIRVASTDIAVGSAYLDALQITPMQAHNDIYWAVCIGDVPFTVGDTFGTIAGLPLETVSEGIYQRFFTRIWGVQFPSSDTPSIADPA